ncbi:MAG: universal stress protein [Candidatus Manganitrophaceae bacterium]|nr:MAG: universal stress protein [Candidatus Manganitrophaceae bacterium]
MKHKKKEKVISRILVPTDFSDCSTEALEYAVSLAKPLQADLILAHVIEPFPYSGVDGMAFINFEERLIPEAQALLDKTSRRLSGEKLSVETHLTSGIPSHEIVNLAEREGADLIVMGPHGRTGINHLMAGSVAEKVVRLSPCPVLTVHSRPAASKQKGAVPRRKVAAGRPH